MPIIRELQRVEARRSHHFVKSKIAIYPKRFAVGSVQQSIITIGKGGL